MNGNAPVKLWGTGTPMREFLHVNDLAQAVLFSLENTLPSDLYNVGTEIDISIKDLAELIKISVGHKGQVTWDNTKPDGTPRKLMDSSRLKSLGWQPEYELREGIQDVYKYFLEHGYR